jgi:preprotein translocase subunit SecD
MNKFATWRYVIIIITIMMSLVYALPNLFGESPAIQIMSIKSGEKIESSVLANVESSLIAENIKNNGIIIEPLYIKVKFASTDDQLVAKAKIQKVLGEKYVVALNLISNSPDWLTSIGALPMYLGLDLRGGVHFLMQLDLSKVFDLFIT